MSIHNIILIWEPEFFKNFNNNSTYNFNSFFWKFIFNPYKSWKWINFNKLSYRDKNELIYIFANLKIVYKYLVLSKEKNIWVSNLIFCSNIVNSYLKIINKNINYIHINFFNYHIIDDSIHKNIENNLFYSFFLNENKNWFSNIKNWDIVSFLLTQSHQIVQLSIINNILKKEKINVKFNINLSELVEFENKINIRKYLKKHFNNINEICLNKKTWDDWFRVKKIFWKIYKKFWLYNNSCLWRKCTFCNIWKIKQSITTDRTNEILNIIKENSYETIWINDPSITVDELYSFCKKIIQRKINIKIHLRTRFSHNLTSDMCKLLWQAWVKYMWIWLESTSTRLNNLMKKYDRDYWKEDFEKLVINCEKNWIKLHYYTIFWFPTETKEEIVDTKDFLLKQLKNNSFFSYTPWFFWLNKWTHIYENKELYWVEFTNKKMGGETFIENYYEKNFFDNKKLLDKVKKDLISKMFFWNNEVKVNTSELFYFLEKSNIFHIQKLLLTANPY